MNTLLFCITDGFAGLRRSKLSGILTIITIAISIFFIGVFALLSNNFLILIDEIKAKVILEVFIHDDLEHEEIAELNRKLYFLAATDSLNYIDKDEALKIYKETFGEAHAQLIDENPLPASFQVFLHDTYLNSDSVNTFVNKISVLKGVESVVYRGEILQLLDQYYRTSISLLIITGIGLSLIGFILVTNNIKLTIAAKKRIIETMMLVGARRAFVRGPFIVQGILEGAAGSVAAIFLLILSIEYVNHYFSKTLLLTPPFFILAIICFGALYGVLGSLYALRQKY